jgi:hypothetical protein
VLFRRSAVEPESNKRPRYVLFPDDRVGRMGRYSALNSWSYLKRHSVIGYLWDTNHPTAVQLAECRTVPSC